MLLLDAPEGMQFGIDNQIWLIGPLFKGVKCIPSGAHFVYFSLKDEEYGSRMGFFVFVKDQPKSIDEDFERSMCTVRRWDDALQSFIEIDSAEEVAY